MGADASSRPAEQPTSGFDKWLNAELRARNISQRQLAMKSGVDPSTISLLRRGRREPSLATVVKLMRALPAVTPNIGPPIIGRVNTAGHPTARIEYALRSDDVLSEQEVRRVMNFYLGLRNTNRARPDGRRLVGRAQW